MTKRVTAPPNDVFRQVARDQTLAKHPQHYGNQIMIQSTNIPQLTSAKPRSGMSSIAELMPRLIRQYELQAEMARRASKNQSRLNPAAATITITASPAQQTTFGWD